MTGIRRTYGTAPDKKAPATRRDIERMIVALPDTLTAIRDKALLLVGFAGAFRRSELVALKVSDVQFDDEAMLITVRRSKTDQEGKGTIKAIPYLSDNDLDPATALRAWLSAAGIERGAIFRGVDRHGQVGKKRLTGRTVVRIVKAAAKAAGLNPDQFAGHSLRAGFITSAAQADVPEWQIQEVSGHKSERVLRGYICAAAQGQIEAVRRVFED